MSQFFSSLNVLLIWQVNLFFPFLDASVSKLPLRSLNTHWRGEGGRGVWMVRSPWAASGTLLTAASELNDAPSARQ